MKVKLSNLSTVFTVYFLSFVINSFFYLKPIKINKKPNVPTVITYYSDRKQRRKKVIVENWSTDFSLYVSPTVTFYLQV